MSKIGKNDNDFEQEIDNNIEENNNLGEENNIQSSLNNDLNGSSLKEFEESSDDYKVVYNDNQNNNLNDSNSSNILDKFKEIYFRDKKMTLLVIAIIVLFILILLLRGCSSGKLKNIEIDIDDIIYVGEITEFNIISTGRGNLDSTNYVFELSNNSIATIEENSLKGNKVTNKINALYSGEVIINVKGTYNNSNKEVNKTVLLCKRFNSDSIILDEFKLKVNQSFYLKDNLDLGISKCKDNIEFVSSDSSVLKIDSEGYATGLKAGSSTVTVSDGESEYKFIVNIA